MRGVVIEVTGNRWNGQVAVDGRGGCSSSVQAGVGAIGLDVVVRGDRDAHAAVLGAHRLSDGHEVAGAECHGHGKARSCVQALPGGPALADKQVIAYRPAYRRVEA